MLFAPFRPRRSLGRFAAAAALSLTTLGAVACGGDDPVSPNVAGTYGLRRISFGGETFNLPFDLFDFEDFPDPCDTSGEPEVGRFVMRFVSGSLVLAANNTFTGDFNITTTWDGTDVSDCLDDEEPVGDLGGTWSVSGNTITLDPSEPGEPNVTGTISGNTITITDQEDVDDDGDLDTVVFVFTK